MGFLKATEKHKVEKSVWFMWCHSDLKLLGVTNCTEVYHLRCLVPEDPT